MPVIRHADSRRSETPNAVMTTLASPTQGDAVQAVWRVDMHPGSAGPPHLFDAEQVWTVLDGGARIDLAGEAVVVGSGDTVVIPAGTVRQVDADATSGLVAVVAAPAGGQVTRPDDGTAVVPPWIA